MLKQKLQQKLLQKLSPQQIQLIKLLEVPAIQLEQRIKKEIEENPVLEEGNDEEDDYNNEEDDYDNDDSQSNDDEFSLEDYMDDDDTPNYRLNANNYSKDDKHTEVPYSEGMSFHEHLLRQLSLRPLTEEQEKLAEYIIGNIDEDGYLRRDIEAIVDDLAFMQNINTDEDELLKILRVIQDFDPPGIGARDLQECLLIQIDKKTTSSSIKKRLELAKRILKEFFLEFTKKHYDKIMDRLNLESDQLRDAVDEILRLNPKPGSGFTSGMIRNVEQIVPDFMLELYNGEFQLNLNAKNAPELRVSRTYADMIETYSQNKEKNTRQDKDAISFIKQKLDSAKWFIDAIKQRQNTLLVTMQAILDYQKEYFVEGEETLLRPMILKDIAEKTKLDISTISRVANSKYIQTHFGILPLKYFFSEGMQTESGEEVSTREIKKILQECVDGEKKNRPLTDERLAKILQEKGYQIARRTVAKYREQLDIPVARLRKEL